MLFQGEEYGETAPFHYFCGFEGEELVEAVRKGRAEEFHYFGRAEVPPDPVAPITRDLAVLSWRWEADPVRAGLRRLYRDLLRLRRASPALRDFGHRPATIRPPGDVLDALRGPEADPLVTQVRAVFNLSAEPRPFPGSLTGARPVFRSEIAAYGSEDTRAESEELRPHEFAIFGTVLPIRLA